MHLLVKQSHVEVNSLYGLSCAGKAMKNLLQEMRECFHSLLASLDTTLVHSHTMSHKFASSKKTYSKTKFPLVHSHCHQQQQCPPILLHGCKTAAAQGKDSIACSVTAINCSNALHPIHMGSEVVV